MQLKQSLMKNIYLYLDSNILRIICFNSDKNLCLFVIYFQGSCYQYFDLNLKKHPYITKKQDENIPSRPSEIQIVFVYK